ncbi:hypothetical protein FM106_11845 [Brachybacterium faecium]|nr:hypothetical protein FM106_11845 [Brachybacterium faecium]
MKYQNDFPIKYRKITFFIVLMYTKVVNQRNEVAHLPFDQPSNYLRLSKKI